MRARIRRFGGLSYRRPINPGIPSESKQELGSAIAKAGEFATCAITSAGCGRSFVPLHLEHGLRAALEHHGRLQLLRGEPGAWVALGATAWGRRIMDVELH